MLEKHEGKSVDEIKISYDNKYDDIIDQYIDFLIKNEYCFFTSNPEYYPKLDLQWHYPFEISNAIIDYNNALDLENILDQLENLYCKNLEIRFYDKVDNNIITNIINYLRAKKSIISAVGFIIPYCELIDYNTIITINPRISYVYFYNCPPDVIASKNGKFENIYFFSDKVNTESHCGIIHQKSFIVNTKSFTESFNHNSCLNKKISIDTKGNIKNCPSMTQSFGNIKDVALGEALNNPDFKKYWNITKDEIDVCKDCEFRHICTDCRAYTEDPQNHLSKPLKCGYSPYTNVWEEWSTNPLKQKGIEYYNMQELVKKHA
ncbi:hypothetical protein D3C87_679740 [compost metagenome]